MATVESIDVLLLQALKKPTDRLFVLRAGLAIEKLLGDAKSEELEFPPLNSYQRMLVHRVAAYYRLEHMADTMQRIIVVSKTAESTIPALKLADLVERGEDAAGESPIGGGQNKGPVKILRRDTKDAANPDSRPISPSASSTSSDAAVSSGDGSAADPKSAGANCGSSTGVTPKSILEREEEYSKARARIFKDFVQQAEDTDNGRDGNNKFKSANALCNDYPGGEQARPPRQGSNTATTTTTTMFIPSQIPQQYYNQPPTIPPVETQAAAAAALYYSSNFPPLPHAGMGNFPPIQSQPWLQPHQSPPLLQQQQQQSLQHVPSAWAPLPQPAQPSHFYQRPPQPQPFYTSPAAPYSMHHDGSLRPSSEPFYPSSNNTAPTPLPNAPLVSLNSDLAALSRDVPDMDPPEPPRHILLIDGLPFIPDISATSASLAAAAASDLAKISHILRQEHRADLRPIRTSSRAYLVFKTGTAAQQALAAPPNILASYTCNLALWVPELVSPQY